MRGLIIESTYAPTLAPAGKAIVLAALVGYRWRNVCTKSTPLNYSSSENAARSPCFTKAPCDISSARNTIQPLTFATLLPNFRNSIKRTKIILCVPVAAYLDVQ